MKIKNINKKDQIRLFIRQKLLSEGYVKIYVDEICTQVRISKKTIYINYSNKEEIIKEFFVDVMNDIYLQVVTIVQSQNSMAAKLEQISEIVKEYLHVFDAASFSKLKVEFPALWLSILKSRRKNFIPLLNLLLDHSRKHCLIMDVPNEFLLDYFTSALNLLADERMLKRNSLSYDEAFTRLFEFLINGIITKKGRKLLAINKRMKNENN